MADKSELLKAQERLMELRAQARRERLAAGLPVDIAQQPGPPWQAATAHVDGETRPETAVSPPPSQTSPNSSQAAPADVRARTHHNEETAVSWDMKNALARINQLRRLNDVGQPETAVSAAAAWLPHLPQQLTSSPDPQKRPLILGNRPENGSQDALDSVFVRVHPDIGLAAKRTGHVGAFQTWLIIAHLDQGRGDVDEQEFLRITSVKGSIYRFSKPNVGRDSARRQARRRVADCIDAGFLHRAENGRLFRTGAAKLAGLLGLARVDCQPVDLPLETVTGSAGAFNAALYAAWHAGRNNTDNPISRQTIERLTAVPERTQRHYDQAAGVKRQTNYSVGKRATAHNVQDGAWRDGRSQFELRDYLGKQGPEGAVYIATRRPNSYESELPISGPGHNVRRRLNKGLGTAGANGGRPMPKTVERLYHETAKAAVKTFNRNPDQPVYHKADDVALTGEKSLWYTLEM
jgi:hypothetical protein